MEFSSREEARVFMSARCPDPSISRAGIIHIRGGIETGDCRRKRHAEAVRPSLSGSLGLGEGHSALMSAARAVSLQFLRSAAIVR